MIGYRIFRNSDPPHLADIWRTHAQRRGLMQPMTAVLLEELVLSKPYFDPQGLIVATDGDHPVGFVHAAFGPTDDKRDLSFEHGATLMLLVRPRDDAESIAVQLLQWSEQYLQNRGAKQLYAGGFHPFDAFYLGLYGGSELPGVLDSDDQTQAFYRAQGYRQIDRVEIYQLQLEDFHPPVDRRQMRIRRTNSTKVTMDPAPRSRWEAWTRAGIEGTRFELIPQESSQAIATVTTWNMEPLASCWGIHAAGLIDLEVVLAQRHLGVATYLLSDTMRQLKSQGITLAEAQARQGNISASGLFKKLGFSIVDRGAVLRKE